MKKKMCDHPAGILFAVIVAFLISFLNYYTMGNAKSASLWLAGAIIVFYVVFCLLCRRSEKNENEEKR